MNVARIVSVEPRQFPDGAVEFNIITQGFPSRCNINYGDGHSEKMEIAKGTQSPKITGENNFGPGSYRVVIELLDEQGKKLDRHVVTWSTQ